VVNSFRYGKGESLAYVESGDPRGHPLLVQHGLIASIKDGHIFKRLAGAGARLICIARPGYGLSSPYLMKDIGEWGGIVKELAGKLRLERFDVLGISSGAPYAYAIGCKCPGLASSLFILSGTPALYDDRVLATWPYPVDRNAGLAGLQRLARELFFPHPSAADLARDEIRDSMRNDCFGIAQDLKLRCNDWGFQLSDVKQKVFMRHSRVDDAVPLAAAVITAGLLPDCRLEIREADPHFSQAVLDDFISTVMAGNLSFQE